MSICYFGFFSYKTLDIILTFIFLTIRHVMRSICYENNSDFILSNIYLNYFIVCIGQCFSIVFFFIQKQSSKSKNDNKEKEKEENNNKNENYVISNFRINILNLKEKEIKFFPSEQRKKYILLIFISSIFGILTPIFLYSIDSSIGEIPIFFILTTLILSKKFLRETYYKHHYFSLIILFLGSVLHFINDYYYEKKENSLIIHILVFFFVSIIYGIQGVIQKFLMENLFISPFVLLTHQGFISIILLIILCYILSFFKCNSKNDRFCNNGKLFTLENIKYDLHIIGISGYFLSSMFYYIMKTLVIYFWTPCHFAVVLSLSELGDITSNFYNFFIDKKNLYYVLIDSFTHIIYIFGTFVFCEFIILKFCELDFHTHNKVHNRNINEVKKMTTEQELYQQQLINENWS